MGALDDVRTLERQLFFRGQRLLAADLDGVVADHRWRRELHNRSLHQPGIGNGFAISGEPGVREVTVGAGYALDAEGREIISTRTRVEPVPPVAGDPDGGPARYDLTVSYRAEEELEEAETREGVCLPRGVVRLSEEPELCWVRLEEKATGELHPADKGLAADIEAGLKIRLARVEIEQCRLKSLSIVERRNARPAEQPYIACGQAGPSWKVVPVPQPAILFSAGLFTLADLQAIAVGGDPAEPFFLTAEIDTSEAGFRSPPCYSADLRGPRRLIAPTHATKPPSMIQIFADGIVSIEKPTPTGFHVRVLPFLFIDPKEARLVDFKKLVAPWTVAWMGVEG